ncbi:MAG TPA: DUF58 domain-containing protein [Solirubrobacterales bacterium]|jgi:uncharacterized protein (DUF58 family)|nr:DUF58 domain-containing protein [Solirubrobacterales bacterium]
MADAATALRLGLGLAFAGLIFAAPIVLLPGLALILLVAVCWSWVRLSAAGVRAGRVGVPAQATEGERFDVVVSGVSGPLPLIGRIEDPVTAERLPVSILRGRSRFSLRLVGSVERRGRRLLPAPAITIGDPLGIATARVTLGEPASLLVLPRIEPLRGPDGADGPAVGRRVLGAGELAGGGERESAADPELDGVRPYRPGTKATRIYWPSVARGAELAERHLVAAGDAAPLIALDPSGSDVDDLDRAVRATASLMAHLARLGGCELLIGGSRQRLRVGRDPREWTAALAALAVVESGDGVPRIAAGDLRAALIWVAAEAPRLPRGVVRGFVVCPRPPAGAPAAFTVSGCTGHEIGASLRARVFGAAA